MDAAFKVVTRLPLQELWRVDGFTTTARGKSLTKDEITHFLRVGRVQFVVADVGASLRWIPLGECFNFWKSDVWTHLVAPELRATLDELPDGYCYYATEWSSGDGSTPIVVLEKHH